MVSDLYADLGVAADASPAEIRRAYKSEARRRHPDAGGSAESFARLGQAYSVLSDQRKRQAYDETGDADPRPESTRSFALLVEAFDAAAGAAGLEVLSTDLTAGMIQRLNVKKRSLESEISRGEKVLEITGKLAARINRTDGGPNMLAELLQQRTREIAGAITAARREQEAVEEALRLAAVYRFDRDKPPAPSVLWEGQFRMGGGTAASSVFFETGP